MSAHEHASLNVQITLKVCPRPKIYSEKKSKQANAHGHDKTATIFK